MRSVFLGLGTGWLCSSVACLLWHPGALGWRSGGAHSVYLPLGLSVVLVNATAPFFPGMSYSIEFLECER